MTNFEYLQKRLSGLGVDGSDIELILMKSRLKGNAPAKAKACDRAIYDNQSVIRKSAIEKTREGGFSMERSAKDIDVFMRTLAIENSFITPWQRFFG